MTQHLERRAAGADDHGGAELGDRHGPGGEDAPDLVTAAQVGRQGRVVVVAQTAEVDDLLEPGLGGRVPEARRRLSVPLGEAGAAFHAVHQVVGRPHPVEGRPERGRVGEVGLHDLDVADPRHARELLRRPGQAAHAVTSLEERRHEAPADVAGGAGDEDGAVVGG